MPPLDGTHPRTVPLHQSCRRSAVAGTAPAKSTFLQAGAYDGETEVILDLLGLVYDAAGDASYWPKFLQSLVRAIGASKGLLAIRDSKHTEFAYACWCGWSDEDIRLYRERYAESDPWRTGTARSPEGVVGTDLDLCPREETEASLAFREFYAPRGAIHGIGAIILVTPTGQATLSILRDADAGPFGEAEKAILRLLNPHLRRAALLHTELSSQRTQLATFTGHLDRYPHAFLLTDAAGRVLYANKAAREIAESRDGIAIEAGGISVGPAKQHTLFREALGSIASRRDASMRRMEISRPSRKQPYRLMLMPVQAGGWSPLGVSLPAVTVLIVDDESRPGPDLAALRELFSLTPAEARVTALLAVGRSVEEIAAEASISVATVRTHIKRTLSKTATERQGELISLILRSTPFRRL
jgi:DNA-binding CsgD family transcriptional regulator